MIGPGSDKNHAHFVSLNKEGCTLYMNEKYIIENMKYGRRSNLQRIGIFWDGEALTREGRETRGERIWRNIAADAG